MAYGWDILSVPRVTRLMQETQDVLTLPQQLKWYERAAKRNVSDQELTAKWKDYIFAADIVTADSKALIRDAGQFSFEQHQIAKIKHGFGLSESMIQTLERIEAGKAMDNEMLSFKSYIARAARGLLVGTQQRCEAMIVGMLLDEFNYDRLGLKLGSPNGGGFGMRSDLKFVPTTAWTDPTSKPITNIINTLQYAHRTYGEAYNRITMSYQALQYIIASNEFKEVYQANAFKWGPVSTTGGAIAAQASNPSFHLEFVANFISAATTTESGGGSRQVTIEIYDGQYRELNPAGTIDTPVPFHPANKILFTNSADDNGGSGWEWGNGIVMEGVIGRLGGTSVIGSFEGTDFGPLGYTTQADPALNPAGLVMWNVARGGPMRHRDTCTAKITAWS